MSDRQPDSSAGPDGPDGSNDFDCTPNQGSASSETTFEEGRYLYCAVALDGSERETDSMDGAGDTDETGRASSPSDVGTEFPAGIDDEPVHLVSLDEPAIGVLVHSCESLYDTDEMARLHKWLLEHQRVVDAAGERFGTPLPFRFDTVITGDDERVREWIGDTAETLDRYLGAFSGCWEYRIEVTTEGGRLDEALEATDDRLADLAGRIEEASSGTSFLLEKQYEQRLAELKRARRGDRSAALEERLAAHAREVHRLGESTTSPLDDESGGIGDDEEEGITEARLALLAREDNEAAIGDVLDEVAAEPGTTVRFTGPWPPYTFAPEIDGDRTEGDDATH